MLSISNVCVDGQPNRHGYVRELRYFLCGCGHEYVRDCVHGYEFRHHVHAREHGRVHVDVHVP